MSNSTQRYERRLRELGVEPTKPLSGALKNLVEKHDLNKTTEVVLSFMRKHGGETNYPGTLLPRILSDTAQVLDAVDDMEKLASVFHSFITIHPKIFTKCCHRKICFRCAVSGWHEGRSCGAFHDVEKMVHILPCPRCKVSLVKTAGCNDVRCPNCNYAFAWGTTKSSGLTLADLRGSNIPAPAVETVRSGYVRTVSDCE